MQSVLNDVLETPVIRTQSQGPVFYDSKRETACYYFIYALGGVLLGVIDTCLHTCDNTTQNAFPIELTTYDSAQEAA